MPVLWIGKIPCQAAVGSGAFCDSALETEDGPGAGTIACTGNHCRDGMGDSTALTMTEIANLLASSPLYQLAILKAVLKLRQQYAGTLPGDPV